MDSSELTLEAVSSVSQIAADDWDTCANPASDPGSLNGLDTLASPNTASDSCVSSRHRYNPFVSHAFFSALEESGSACARTGWGPRPVPGPPGDRAICWPGSTARSPASCPAI